MISKCTTRRIYKFEQEAFKNHKFAKIGSIKYLRVVAHYLWKVRNKKKNLQLEIVCGKGTKYNGRYLSYCHIYEDKARIVLARNQRDIITLVHEIVHAQGYGEHDDRFAKKVLFYLEHLGYDRRQLRELAKQYKLI